MNRLFQDLRYAIRQLRKNPGFTMVAVLTLALGIGLNTTVFTLFDAIVLRPLPVKDPATIVNVFQRVTNEPGSYRSFSYPEYIALRDFNTVFSGLIAHSWIAAELRVSPTDGGSGVTATQTQEAHGLLVSGSYFTVLGGEPAAGRTFTSEENRSPGAQPVLVMSHALWKRRFNSDPAMVGKNVILNGVPFTVVGISRPDFVGTEPQTPDFWAPLTMQPQLMPGDNALNDRNSFWLEVVGRLKPGVSLGQAEAGMNVLLDRLAPEYLHTNGRASVLLTPGSFLARPDVREQVNSLAFLVMGAVGMVLLIACVNVASLQLARAAGRHKEIGMRVALGASRRRLIQQLLTESTLIALLGGGAGLLLAWRMPNFLITVLQPPYEQAISLRAGLDTSTLGYALLLSLATGLAFGFAPALQASKPNLWSALKDEGMTFGQRISRRRLHNLLVTAETSVCLVLVLGAGLFVRALQRAQKVDPGFDIHHVLAVSLDLRLHGYDETRAAQFHRELTDRLMSIPSVKSVSLASLAPLGGVSRSAPIAIAGGGISPSSSQGLGFWVISPNYFETLGIPIVQGRSFTAQDTQGGPAVAIINEAMARQVWPGEKALGKRLRLGPASVPFAEIVGVAKDVRGARLWETDEPYVYLPVLQIPQGPPIQTEQMGMTLLVRTGGDAGIVAAMLPDIVRKMDPNVQASGTVLRKSLGRWLWFSQVGAVLSSVLGFLALFLAAVGIYGVMSYAVRQRTHEMGIRLALGASKNDVRNLIVLQGLRPILLGLAIGLLMAFAATRIIDEMLYGVKPFDPVTIATVGGGLIAVALFASYVPARRAMKTDPMVALRYE
jgi:putative ABC transport system permease protein